MPRRILPILLMLFLLAGPAFGQQGRFSFTRLWTGGELQKLNLGGGNFPGNPKEWQSSAGVAFGFNYPGTGPLPEPIVVRIPLGQTLPLGHYRLYVKNFYLGKMEATLGDITKPLRIVRFDWSVVETFEINEPADQVTLRYFPTDLVAGSGKAHQQYYILQGLFITTEANKVPKFAGEIVDLVAEDTPPARSGNYLENGGFEAGLTGWGKWYGSATPVLRAANLETSGPAEGRYALRLEVPANDRRFGVETKLYRVPPDRSYTLSFAARADRPLALRAYLNGISEDLKNYSSAGISAAVNLTTEWQRFTVSGRLASRPGFLYTLVMHPQADERPAVVWLDAVQLQEGPVTPFQGREPREVGWISNTPGNVFYEREPARVELLVSGGGNAAVDYQTVDFWGQVVDRGRKEVAGGRAAFDLYAGRRGLFRTTFSLGGSLSELVYSVLPANPHLNEKYPAGTLGTDIGATVPYHLEILKRANFNWVISKTFGRWYIVEPEPGKYVFNDEAVRAVDRANILMLIQPLNIGWGIQPWLKEYEQPPVNSGAVWEPAKRAFYMKAWGEFIYTLISRYKPYVKHWEIENEPNAGFTPEQYAEILKVASREIRRADPAAKVVGFSGGGYSRKFYDPVLQACGPENFDIVSVHFYGYANPDFANFLKETGKPGWNTEVGSTGPSFFTSLPNFDSVKEKNYWQLRPGIIRANAVSDVRTYLSSMSVGGIEKYFYYFARFGNCGPSQPTTWAGGGKELVEYDGSLRANAVGLSIASHFIDGGRYQGALELDKTVTAHLYRKAAGTAGFFWVTEAKVFKAAPPAGLKFYDLMGNPIEPADLRLTESPVYFTGPADPAATAASLKTMRLEAAN